MGDPCGIGPELCVKALVSGRVPRDVSLAVVGSRRVLSEAQDALGLGGAERPETIDLDNFPPEMISTRAATAEGGRASVEYIETAVSEILAGRADGLVTCPISKEAIGAAGSAHPGHTEMLGKLTGARQPVMLLISGALRVAFATTHLAVRDVAAALSADGIAHTCAVLADALRTQFAVPSPRIAVCALNPHGGDGGRFGDEEARVIAPAVEEARRGGTDASGPWPSDTLFARAAGGEFDAVAAMYHDQGMIPIKLSGVAGVVNVTLGLPIIRTSPGHGTAYDIAGRGVADESSLLAAIALAAEMARRSRPREG